MTKTWKVIGITALVTGVLAYPAYKLIKYIGKRIDEKNKGDEEEEEEGHVVKAFVPAYRGKKHKPHHDHN